MLPLKELGSNLAFEELLMRKMLALILPALAVGFMGTAAQAWGRHHGPPCPDTHYWYLSTKGYAEWKEFGLFRGSWGEKHKVVRRHRGGVVVKVWRPAYPCR